MAKHPSRKLRKKRKAHNADSSSQVKSREAYNENPSSLAQNGEVDLQEGKEEAAVESEPPKREKKSWFARKSFLVRSVLIGSVAVVLIYLINLTLGAFAAATAFTIMGAIASFALSRIEQQNQEINARLLMPWTPESWIGMAFLSIILFQVVEFMVRLWLIPWRLKYGVSFSSSPSAILGGVIFEFLGLVLCGFLIGYLMPARALPASIMGASLFLGINSIEAYTGAANYSNFTFIASLVNLEPDIEGFEIYRLGLVTGTVFRGAFVIAIARYVARRRIRRGLVFK